jgi:hypothetical protein
MSQTNPGPIGIIIKSQSFVPQRTDFMLVETIICMNPLVEAAMVIGHGRNHIGVLLQPAAGHQVPLNDIVALENYRNAIWYAKK